VGRAIRSVLEQSYQLFEIIVIDDGSTDNSSTVVEEIADPRIRLIRQENNGVSAARNKGILVAKNTLIAFLDADDAWKPWFLETIALLIKSYPEANWYATNYERRYKSRIIVGCPRIADDFLGKINDFFANALDELPIHISSVVIRRAAFDLVGMFPVGVKYGEDQDLFCRLALHEPLAYCGKICTSYILDSENRACKQLRVPELWPFLKEYEAYLHRVEVDTARSIRSFVARRYLTRAKKLKDMECSEEAKLSLAVAECTGMLPERCQEMHKYCDTPMIVIRLMAQYKYYKGRVQGLIRRIFPDESM